MTPENDDDLTLYQRRAALAFLIKRDGADAVAEYFLAQAPPDFLPDECHGVRLAAVLLGMLGVLDPKAAGDVWDSLPAGKAMH